LSWATKKSCAKEITGKTTINQGSEKKKCNNQCICVNNERIKRKQSTCGKGAKVVIESKQAAGTIAKQQKWLTR